jgi:hypothetical protein
MYSPCSFNSSPLFVLSAQYPLPSPGTVSSCASGSRLFTSGSARMGSPPNTLSPSNDAACASRSFVALYASRSGSGSGDHASALSSFRSRCWCWFPVMVRAPASSLCSSSSLMPSCWSSGASCTSSVVGLGCAVAGIWWVAGSAEVGGGCARFAGGSSCCFSCWTGVGSSRLGFGCLAGGSGCVWWLGFVWVGL